MKLTETVRLSLSEAFPVEGAPLLVALSGGADSVCLLLVLQRLGYAVEALHCNFELRGSASDGDEAFCRRLCRARGIALQVRHFRTRAYARRRGISIEMAARDLRYAWFREEAARRGARAICVGHHRDDSIETFLLNLVRGSGIRGLTGLKAVTPGPDGGCPVVRPLLDLGREDIEAWLREQDQAWVTDHTNLDADAALRNKIRLRVLPLLEELNPRVRETLSRTARRLAEAEALYDDAVRHVRERVVQADGSVSVEALRAAPSPQTVLHELLHLRGFTAEQVREIHAGLGGEPGRLWQSTSGWRLLRDRERLLQQPDAPRPDASGRVVPLEGLFDAGGGVRFLVRRQAVDPAAFVVPRDRGSACFDLEKLSLPLTVRPVQDADRFRPFGMEGTRLVSDLLTDHKLSLFDKERQLVVCSAETIVWVVGLRVAAGFEVDARTRHVLSLTLL